jgi:hypothetical protein
LCCNLPNMGYSSGNSEALIEQAARHRNESDIFAAAQTAVSEVLTRYRLANYEHSGVKAVRISDRLLAEISKDPTVPDGKRCWMLSVGTALRRLDLECYERPVASLILGAREVRDRHDNLPLDWRQIAKAMRLSVARVQQIHERAVWHFRMRLEPFGDVPMHWRDDEQVM